MDKRLLTVSDLARYIGHSPGTIRNQICQGTLPFGYIKQGRKVLFDRLDVDAWIDNLIRFKAVN